MARLDRIKIYEAPIKRNLSADKIITYTSLVLSLLSLGLSCYLLRGT